MRPLHCYTNESCFSFLFIFANSLLILSIPFIHQCVFDVYCARQRTYIHVFGDSLCKVNICHRIARCSLRVHRLPTVDFIFILFCVCVCVCIIVHVDDFSLNLRWRSWQERVCFSLTDKVVVLLQWIWLVEWQISLLQLYSTVCMLGASGYSAYFWSFLNAELERTVN